MLPEIAGESVRGYSHIRNHTPCQDSWKKTILPDDTVILSVADGHGSSACPFSKSGSRIACNVFSSLMSKLYYSYEGRVESFYSFLHREGSYAIARSIDREWKRRVLRIHKMRLRKISTNNNDKADLDEVYAKYGTTLLGLMISGDLVFAFQLGDGDICCVTNGNLVHVTNPNTVLGVETYSLCQDESWKQATSRVCRNSRIESAVYTLTTDGFSNSYATKEQFSLSLLDYISVLHREGIKMFQDNLRGWLMETSQFGSGDDITMVAARCSPNRTC